MRRNSSADRPKRRRASWSSACQTSSRAQAASQPLLPSGTPRCSWTQHISGDSVVRRSPVTHPTRRTITLVPARSADELRPRTESVLPPTRRESATQQPAFSPHSPQKTLPRSYSDRTLPHQSPQPRHPSAGLSLPPPSHPLPSTSPTLPPSLTAHYSPLTPSSPLPALPLLPATHALIALQASPSSPAPGIPGPSSRRPRPGPSTMVNPSAPCVPGEPVEPHPWIPTPQALASSEFPPPTSSPRRTCSEIAAGACPSLAWTRFGGRSPEAKTPHPCPSARS